MHFQGNNARIFQVLHGDKIPREIIVEGPAGTGKTFACGFAIRTLMERFPGIRIALLRKVRADIADSVLRTWEEYVLGPDHYTVRGGPSRDGRRRYQFKNGSELVIGGLDRDTRLFSAEYDGFWINELTELSEGNWERLARALRNKRLPTGQFRLGDTNPVEPSNWVNRRADLPTVERIVTRHWDNPRYFVPDAGWTHDGIEYVETLRTMTGVRRDRLLYGKWVAAEGAIYPNFDRSVHVVERSKVPEHFAYYIGGQDFGMHAPGVLGVWGIEKREDYGDRMWLLYEVYHAGMGLDWWGQQFATAFSRYPMLACACDHEPDRIGFQNQYLAKTGNGAKAVCVLAKKDRHAGHQLVRSLLDPAQPGGPRILFVEDALIRRDQQLDDARRPLRTVDEIDSYIYREQKDEDDKPSEDPDPNCADHGMDAMRYAAMLMYSLSTGEKGKKSGRAYRKANKIPEEYPD